MKKHIIIALTLLFIGCAPKVSEHFDQNRYVRNYWNHVINDSLQLYYKSPADIIYTTNGKDLKRIIREQKYELKDPVLIYGKTDEPPYDYFVTISSKDHERKYPKELVVFDTTINQQTIRFIGNSLSQNSKRNLEVDLENIFKSLEVGPAYRKEISTVMDVVEKYNGSNKFFAALHEIRDFPTYDKQEEWTKFQMELTFSSFLGDNDYYDAYLNQLESRFNQNDSIADVIKENAETGSKVYERILEEADAHKIVMINENHFYPNHRALVSDLLVKLKEIGYTYFALEALSPQQDSLLNRENAHPTLETGFYTREQNLSNLIRKAKALGFEFVAYENTDSNKNRELGQAENLYNKTFKINPQAKVLVLAGIDHILENPTSRGKEWMASIFKRTYNIDPLTISQTHLNVYRNRVASTYGIISSSFFEKDPWSSVDYLVLNNSASSQNHPSTYSYTNEATSDVQVCLFYGNEIMDEYDYHKKVPYFSTLLKAGKRYELPIDNTQEIYLYTFDKDGKRLDKQIIKSNNHSQ